MGSILGAIRGFKAPSVRTERVSLKPMIRSNASIDVTLLSFRVMDLFDFVPG